MAKRRSSFLTQVDRGLEGKNLGLPNGLGSMNDMLYNILPSRYYLIGGESGSGKTTLLDHAFVFSPYYALKNDEMFKDYKLSINYLSFEQSSMTKQSKWASHLIKKKHGIWIPPSLSLGRTKRALTAEQYEFCKEANEELEELLECVDLIDHSMGPSEILAYMIRYGARKGTWHFVPKLDAEGNKMYNKKKEELKTISGWTPNDPSERHIFLIDHIAYANLEAPTLKQNIDFISRTIVKFREITSSWTFGILQQFNTELASIERQKFRKSALAPQRVDFGDSRYTYQDADVVIGTLNPYKYDIIDMFQGYNDIAKFKGLAVWAFIMKNRHEGPADVAIPFLMDPVGIDFKEIPNIDAMQTMIGLGMVDNPLDEIYELADEIDSLINLYK